MGRVDPVERVLNLLTLLHESRRPLTRAEIVDALAPTTPYPADDAALHQMFSADRRTITADLGIAVHQRIRGGNDAGRTEYWIDVHDVHLPRLALDHDERLVLSLALAAVGRTAPHVGEASMRLSSWIGATGARSAVSPYEFSVDVPDPVVVLMEVARAGRVVRRGPGVFEPWAVVLSEGAWYVVGHDEVEGVPEALRVDAFAAGVELVAGVSRSVDPLELDEGSLALLLRGGRGDVTEPEVATVLVDESTAVRASLSGRVLERSQVDLFGDVALKVVVDDEARFRSWLLALLDGATLVAPARRRDEMETWLRAIADTPPSGSAIPERPADAGRRRGPEPVAERLRRLLSIVPWLYRQRSVPVVEVAERVGATVDQVVRDLTLASMCGTPPYGAGELYGFWVEPEAGTVNVLHPTLLTDDVRLTPRQAASVAVALASIEALPGEHRAAADRLRRKLDDALGGVPVRVTLDDPPFLDDVVAAAEAHERIRIEYV
ncbi:MAG: WYL domain-containing protein, partial [Ilumatobacteraceae bacterium]